MKKLTIVCLAALLCVTSWAAKAQINVDYNIPPVDINTPTHSTSLALEPASRVGIKVAGVYWLPDYLDKNLDFTNRSQSGGEKPVISKDCANMGYAIPAFVSDWNKYDYTKFLAANAVYCYKNFVCKDIYAKSSCPQWYQLAGNSCKDTRGTFYERCDPKPCAATYTAGIASCSPAAGYTYASSGYSGAQICGKCEAKACPTKYSTSVTSCASGYSFATNGMSGSSNCGICNQRACSEGGYYDAPLSNATYKCSTVTWGGKTCQSCYQPQCTEGGYQTGSTKTGYICKAASYYGRNCYDCSTPDPCYNLTDKAPCSYGCETTYSQCTSKCSKCYADNCRNRTAVSTPYGCQTAFADCPSKCQVANNPYETCKIGSILYADKQCSSKIVNGNTAIAVVFDPVGRLAVALTITTGRQWVEAVKYCRTYSTAGAAAGRWFLASHSELYRLMSNDAVVSETLKKFGYSNMNGIDGPYYSSSPHWHYSSTETGRDGVLTLNRNKETLAVNKESNAILIRPILAY